MANWQPTHDGEKARAFVNGYTLVVMDSAYSDDCGFLIFKPGEKGFHDKEFGFDDWDEAKEVAELAAEELEPVVKMRRANKRVPPRNPMPRPSPNVIAARKAMMAGLMESDEI